MISVVVGCFPAMHPKETNLSIVISLFLLVLSCSANLVAADSFLLEANVFVFKDSDFKSVKIPTAKEPVTSEAVTVRSPATIEFDHDVLTLAGSDFSWSGGRNPPDRFTLIAIPRIITGPGKMAGVLSTAPLQYIEKEPDGTLQVRNIAKDSADAPHCRIFFTVVPEDEASEDLRVACELDMATVSARENVPGVSLDIGRPLLVRFQHRSELAVRSGEWAAMLLRKPNGSDCSLLLLLKIAPAPTAGDAAKTDRLFTAKEFAKFATFYYRFPQPELISRAIESMEPTKLLDDGKMSAWAYHQDAYTCVGFFAEVFRANPERVAEWQKVIDRVGGDTRFWLNKALKLRRPGGAILALGADNPINLSELEADNVMWGAFIASGNPAYLRRLTDRLEFADEGTGSLFDAGGVAMMLLAYNAPHHPLVRQTLEASRKESGERTRELIDDLLNKDLAALLQEVRKMDHTDTHSDSLAYDSYYLPWRQPRPPTSYPFNGAWN